MKPGEPLLAHFLIQDLFASIDDLSGKLSEAESELRDKKDIVKLTRSQVREGEKQIQALKLERVRLVSRLVYSATELTLVGSVRFCVGFDRR
jgi:hypothetical protein